MTENQMKAEKYLSQIRTKAEKLHSIRLEIEALEYAASGVTGIRYDRDKIQTTPDGDKMAVFVNDLIERRAESDELSAELDELKVNAYCIIRTISDIDERNVLEWFYMQASTMQTIINKMNWSERKVYYIRDDALENFGAKI